MGQVSAAAEATILTDLPGGAVKPERAADLALGVRLRAYAFDRYKTRRKDEDDRPKEVKVAIAVANVPATQKAYAARAAVADGVVIARDLINEPANVLYPEEFARRAANLKKLGVAVEVLDVAAMTKLGMNALLGVGQGSAHESRTGPDVPRPTPMNVIEGSPRTGTQSRSSTAMQLGEAADRS